MFVAVRLDLVCLKMNSVDFVFFSIGSEFLVVHSMRSHSASSYDGLNVVIHYWHHFQVHLILLHLTLNVA